MPANTNYEAAMRQAITAAEDYMGATSPNPPVGAAALDAKGGILAVAAHQKAGMPHAEAQVLSVLRAQGSLSQLHTLVVTLEPCNHQGRTPPCTEALIAAGVKTVVYGVGDPNPQVLGGGAKRLAAAGVQVVQGVLADECALLVRSFTHHAHTKRPFVRMKVALNEAGSMIPPPGQKTFTSKASLEFAHQMRRRADAILTGSGTVLADNPEFTVRLVPDHPGKRRWLVLLDRRGRVSAEWKAKAAHNGFAVVAVATVEAGLELLGREGALEVLVEAGPTLTEAIKNAGLWQEIVEIQQGGAGASDKIRFIENPANS